MKRLALCTLALFAAACGNSTGGASGTDLPTCGEGEYLTSDGETLRCVKPAPPSTGGSSGANTGSSGIASSSSPATSSATSAQSSTSTGGGLTLPTCNAGEVLTTAGGSPVCVPLASLMIPSCGGNEVLTSDGAGGLTCRMLPAGVSFPVCQNGEFLTGLTGGAIGCVRPAALPTCQAGQVLTSVNGAPTCVAALVAPTCNTGEVLSASNGALSCAMLPMQMFPACQAGQLLTSMNGTLTCVGSLAIPGCASDETLTGNADGTVLCKKVFTPTACGTGEVLTASATGPGCVNPATANMSIANAIADVTTATNNISSLTTRVTAVEGRPTASTYVGSTATPVTGRFVKSGSLPGVPSADAMCDTVRAGAHMCTWDDITRSMTPVLSGGSAIAEAWVNHSTGAMTSNAANTPSIRPFVTNAGGSSMTDNCQGWTYQTADTGAIGTTVKTRMTSSGETVLVSDLRACNVALPIACCK